MASIASPTGPRQRLDGQVVARIASADLQRLRELAARHDRSIGRELRAAVAEHIRRHGNAA